MSQQKLSVESPSRESSGHTGKLVSLSSVKSTAKFVFNGAGIVYTGLSNGGVKFSGQMSLLMSYATVEKRGSGVDTMSDINRTL